MGTEREDREDFERRADSVGKVLAALGRAEVPEGLEARVIEGMERRALGARAPAGRGTDFRWRDLFAGTALAGVWWRGAVSGAAVAMLAVGVVMLGGRLMRVPAGPQGQGQMAVGAAGAAALSQPDRDLRPVASPVGAKDEAVGKPCVGAGFHQVPGRGVARSGAMLRVGGVDRLHAAPALGLTAQERGLVRLVRVADPKDLATLNPELRAKLEAEKAAEFDKFFAPPPRPPTTEDNE